MRKQSVINRYWIWALVLAAGTGAGVTIISAGAGPARPLIEPGTTVLSTAADGITSLTYTTGAMKLTAQRSRLGGPFAVQVTFADGRATQQCKSSPDLAGQLTTLSEITAKRQLTPQQASSEFPVQLGTIGIADQVATEPPPTMAVRTNRDRTAIALIYGIYAVEAAVPATTFSKLASGCSALAQE
jgi:hypothetical protein